MATNQEINALGSALGVRVWQDPCGDYCTEAENGLGDVVFATAAGLHAHLQRRLNDRGDRSLETYLALALAAHQNGQALILQPDGLVQVVSKVGFKPVNLLLAESKWPADALEQITQRPPKPITLTVIRQQAADLGARVVERDTDRIEVYLPSTERRIHEERHDFRTVEAAGAFLSGIAVRKAQFG